MLRHALLGALALACAATAARADEAPAPACIAIALAKGPIAEHQGRWINLTPEQWHFLRGIYVTNPEMRLPGLPYGDRGVLATVPENKGAGLVFFLDGDKACTPMPVPKELIDMLGDVAAGIVNHEGTSN